MSSEPQLTVEQEAVVGGTGWPRIRFLATQIGPPPHPSSYSISHIKCTRQIATSLIQYADGLDYVIKKRELFSCLELVLYGLDDS